MAEAGDDTVQKNACGSYGVVGANSPATARSCTSQGEVPRLARRDHLVGVDKHQVCRLCRRSLCVFGRGPFVAVVVDVQLDVVPVGKVLESVRGTLAHGPRIGRLGTVRDPTSHGSFRPPCGHRDHISPKDGSPPHWRIYPNNLQHKFQVAYRNHQRRRAAIARPDSLRSRARRSVANGPCATAFGRTMP